jgi:ribosome hibernation promoting factor
MKISTTARHCELDPEDRLFLQQRLERLLRYFRDPRDLVEAHVVVGVEKYRHSAEITLKLRRGEVMCREEANDSRSAIDQAAERLEHRILRIKEKRLSRKREGLAREAVPVDSSSATEEDMLEQYFDEPVEGAGQGGIPRGE